MESTSPTPEIPAAAAPGPKPNFAIALGAGIVAALIGAIVWAVVTVTAEYQLGLMAIGVGFLVGYAVRMGHGTDKIFGFMGAALALVGCLLGNFLSMVGFAAKAEHLNYLSALSAIDLAKVPNLMISTFDMMDVVFYAIAVYEGYRFSIKQPVSAVKPVT